MHVYALRVHVCLCEGQWAEDGRKAQAESSHASRKDRMHRKSTPDELPASPSQPHLHSNTALGTKLLRCRHNNAPIATPQVVNLRHKHNKHEALSGATQHIGVSSSRVRPTAKDFWSLLEITVLMDPKEHLSREPTTSSGPTLASVNMAEAMLWGVGSGRVGAGVYLGECAQHETCCSHVSTHNQGLLQASCSTSL